MANRNFGCLILLLPSLIGTDRKLQCSLGEREEAKTFPDGEKVGSASLQRRLGD